MVSGRKFRLPCVYEFLRGGAVLYVGRSDAGFSRAFRGYNTSKSVTVRGTKYERGEQLRTEAFNICDDIRVTVFDNIEEARAEEIRLIKLHKPAANKHHKK